MSNGINSATQRHVPCYFCNNFLEEKHLLDHVKYCGSVLEECPFKCGVYVLRKNLENHRKTCQRNVRQRQVMETEGFLWRNKVFSALALLRSLITNEERERGNLQGTISRCLSVLHLQQESIDNLRFQVVETVEECRQRDRAISQRLDNLEVTCDNMEHRNSISFEKISKQLKLLHEELINEQNKHGEVFDNWCLELKDIKTFLTRENARINKMWQEQQQMIHDLKVELEMRCKSSKILMEHQDHLIEKVNNLEEEVQGHSAIVNNENSTIKGLKFQMKENVKYLEELIRDHSRSSLAERFECSYEQECADQYSINGRLLWRIDGYKEKMADAKEHGCALYSPKFSNNEYGYALRMELFLNGIGQWKDRHIIGCLRVETGKWDPLLDWPCILKATVTLRNQENPRNDIKKLVKAVGQDKSKDVNKESGTYMFIPHTAITRYSGYIKDDALFLDIQVKDIRTSTSTPSLIS